MTPINTTPMTSINATPMTIPCFLDLRALHVFPKIRAWILDDARTLGLR